MAWWFTRRAERELDDEIAAHLELAVRDLVARGETPAQAEQIARREFGNLTAIREHGRDEGGSPLLDRAAQDLRHAIRRIRAQPGAAALAVAMLTLAIGVSAAMFTIVDAFLIRPLPFADADTLSRPGLADDARSFGNPNLPLAIIRAWRGAPSARPGERPVPGFRVVHAVAQQPVTFGSGDEEQVESGALISPGLIEELGEAPLLGRSFVAGEGAAGTAPIVMIHEALWRTRFAADPGIVGRTIDMSGERVTVVGVMPASFLFPFARTRVWRPLDLDRPAGVLAPSDRAYAYVRLDPAVPRAEIARVAFETARLADPAIRTGHVELDAINAGTLDAYSAGAVRALAAGVALVFLVLSLNVTTLMLARLGTRRHEMALCAALGASRGRLLRQALWEQFLIGAAACVLGLVLADALVSLARAGLPADILWRTLNPLDLDERAAGAAIALSLTATMIAGVLPAWLATRRESASQLQAVSNGSTAAPGRKRLTTWLVAGELALVMALTVAAGVQLRSFLNLLNEEHGLDAERLVAFPLTLANANHSSSGRLAQTAAIRAELEHLAGVEGVTVSYGAPPTGGSLFLGDKFSDRPGAQPVSVDAHGFSITEDFFRVYGVRLLEGRPFAPGDPADSVIVSQRLATALWPKQSAVGHVIRVGPRALRIVGVSREVRNPLIDPRDDPPELFEPLVSVDPATGAPGITAQSLRVTVRCGAGCPPPDDLRARIRAVTVSGRVGAGRPLRDEFTVALERPRAGAIVAAAFAAIALVAAAFGLFAVLSRALLERRRELGIRAALGATPSELRGLVYRRSLGIAGAGLAAGGVLAAALGRVLAAIQYGVDAVDPLTWFAASALIVVAALLATVRPGRYAMRVDPVTLLRRE